MSSFSINVLAKKVASILPDLESRGNVYFFALGERAETNRWEVLFSADWADDRYSEAVRIVAGALVAKLAPAELTMLSSVAIIPSTEPNILDLPASLEDMVPEQEKIIEFTMMGLEIRRIFVFKARSARQAKSEQNLAAATAAVV